MNRQFHMNGWASKTRFEKEAKGNLEMAYLNQQATLDIYMIKNIALWRA